MVGWLNSVGVLIKVACIQPDCVIYCQPCLCNNHYVDILFYKLMQEGLFFFLSDCTFPVAILTNSMDGALLVDCGLICIRLLKFGPYCGISGFLGMSLYFFLLMPSSHTLLIVPKLNILYLVSCSVISWICLSVLESWHSSVVLLCNGLDALAMVLVILIGSRLLVLLVWDQFVNRSRRW